MPKGRLALKLRSHWGAKLVSGLVRGAVREKNNSKRFKQKNVKKKIFLACLIT